MTMTRERPDVRVFALKQWSVREENGEYFIAPTTFEGDKPTWSKGYASLQHATTAIARKLQMEFTERNNRTRR